jgi:hypothetical protein
MTKRIGYKNHIIVLDGVVAYVFDHNVSTYDYIYKTRFIDAVETVKSLKSFINLRLEQLERDKHINIYA